MSTLVIRWPILDDTRTVNSLKAEAREDLFTDLDAHVLRLQGETSWRVLHGDTAYLEAQVHVKERYRLTGLPFVQDHGPVRGLASVGLHPRRCGMSADPKIDRTVQNVSVVALIVIAVLTAGEPCLAAIDTSDRTHALYQELVEMSAGDHPRRRRLGHREPHPQRGPRGRTRHLTGPGLRHLRHRRRGLPR